MSVGTYGIKKPANFIPNEHAEIYLSYRENRTVQGTGFELVETSKYLTTETIGGSHVDGLYQLKMPLEVFNKVGIYNLYIRPKQIDATIQDIGVLSTYPDVRGIVLNASLVTGMTINDNDGLVGYRIEYLDSNNIKKPNLFRIITSSNKCEPTNSGSNGITSYRFNDSSNLVFLTVSPSSASSAKPLNLPYIGMPQDKIIITNTFFNPEMVEIEMTENDIESLYLSINGNQIRNLDNGIVTTYDKNNNVVNQSEHYIIKESATGKPIYEVKENKSDIINQNYNEIVSEV